MPDGRRPFQFESPGAGRTGVYDRCREQPTPQAPGWDELAFPPLDAAGTGVHRLVFKEQDE